jgi:ribosomal 50S subunit-recycling heat shock protein
VRADIPMKGFFMRLDKFLKVSRIIKRRTVANNACDSEHVKVNGKDAKASYNVKVGDVIEAAFGERIIKIRVKDIKEHTLKNDASELYEVIS